MIMIPNAKRETPKSRREIESQLISKLIEASAAKDRCPNLKIDSVGPYCGKDLASGKPVPEGRRTLCDIPSLQLYCLDPSRYDICYYKNAEIADES